MSTVEILLIEDNADDEYLALRALRGMGISRIAVARDGAEALALLHGAEPCVPDLVLLDLRLPRVDGVDVLRGIRNHAGTRHLRVVVLSSSEYPQEIEACQSLGALAVGSKPLKPELVLPFMRTLAASEPGNRRVP